MSPFLLHHPGQLAKRIASIDRISDGRVTLGIGAGDLPAEFKAFGLPREPLHEERMARLEEWVTVVSSLLEAREPVSFHGRFYVLDGADLTGLPVQRPRPPFWFGGDSDRILRLVAEHGQGWNTMTASIEAFRSRRDVLQRHLTTAHRSLDEVEASVFLKWVFDRSGYQRWVTAEVPKTRQFQEFYTNEVGTAAEAEAFVSDWRNEGVRTFVLWVWPPSRVLEAIDDASAIVGA